MVDALAAPGAALVATPDSGKRTSERATRTWCTPARRRLALTPHADVCNMKPGAFTFYSPAACAIRTCYRPERNLVFIADARQPKVLFPSVLLQQLALFSGAEVRLFRLFMP